MNIVIFHQNKKISLLDNAELLHFYNNYACYQLEDISNFSFFEIIANEAASHIVFIYKNINDLLNVIKGEFELVQAAGGLVYNDNNDLLVIKRNGFWDLPKGKLEKNESVEDCALREVEEETGVTNLILIDFCSTTYHTYILNNQYILKETFWYFMKNNLVTDSFHPQKEEGIELVKWVKKQDLEQIKLNTFENIKTVIDQFYLLETN